MKVIGNKEQDKKIFDARIMDNLNRGEHYCNINGKEFIVLPNVFSPAIFPNTQWFCEQFLNVLTPVDSFLEIGAGVGHVLVEACISQKCKSVMGSDINEHAVECAKLNLQKYGQKAEVFVSDVLDQIPVGKTFDLIYWNCPFHFAEDRLRRHGPYLEKREGPKLRPHRETAENSQGKAQPGRQSHNQLFLSARQLLEAPGLTATIRMGTEGHR